MKKTTILGVRALSCLKKPKINLTKVYTYLLILLLYLMMGQLQAQEKVGGAVDVISRGIQIGQKVPDVVLSGLHNYKDGNGKPASSAKLSDFKGKVLILDFWATWCSPCIAMIPKMDSLQRVLGDRLAFLSVTDQSAEVALPFLKKLEALTKKIYDLPVVTGDKQLNELFPHVSLPHYVWIDEQGVVREMTGFEQVNEANLRKFVNQGKLGLGAKTDFFRSFNPEQSLSSFLADDKEVKKVYESTFSGHILGVTSQTYAKIVGDTYTLTAANLSLSFLYKVAYSNNGFLKARMIEMAVADSSKLAYSLKGDALQQWIKEYTYCYQLKIPRQFLKDASKMMQKDLAALFAQYDAGLERKSRKCWVLKVVGDTSRLKPTDVKPYLSITPFKVEMRKANLATLVYRLDSYDLQKEWPLFVDDELRREVDLVIEGNIRSIEGLNKALLPYGLGFVSEFRDQDVLVIKDRLKQKEVGDER